RIRAVRLAAPIPAVPDRDGDLDRAARVQSRLAAALSLRTGRVALALTDLLAPTAARALTWCGRGCAGRWLTPARRTHSPWSRPRMARTRRRNAARTSPRWRGPCWA